ncbi:hypothetical protein N7528_006036 [Penicillium herquei]|nr:hypothetical protein N7528_006036 [Penicillium herquei]
MTFYLSPSASGCLSISSSIFRVLAATNNGVETCSRSIDNGDENLECISGFSLTPDYTLTDSNSWDLMPITYCNPSSWYDIYHQFFRVS